MRDVVARKRFLEQVDFRALAGAEAGAATHVPRVPAMAPAHVAVARRPGAALAVRRSVARRRQGRDADGGVLGVTADDERRWHGRWTFHSGGVLVMVPGVGAALMLTLTPMVSPTAGGQRA